MLLNPQIQTNKEIKRRTKEIKNKETNLFVFVQKGTSKAAFLFRFTTRSEKRANAFQIRREEDN